LGQHLTLQSEDGFSPIKSTPDQVRVHHQLGHSKGARPHRAARAAMRALTTWSRHCWRN